MYDLHCIVIHNIGSVFAKQIEGGRKNPHQGTVSVILQLIAAAQKRGRALLIPIYSSRCRAAYIKSFTVRSICPGICPKAEFIHDIIVIYSAGKTVQQAKRHTCIVGPGPQRLVKSTIFPETGYRILIKHLPAYKFDRHPQSIADSGPHDTCDNTGYLRPYVVFKCFMYHMISSFVIQ